MPILFVHGVNVRDRQTFLGMEAFLRRYVAPAISANPDSVLIDDVYWGDLGATFAWGGASRPRSRLIGMGTSADPLVIERALTANDLNNALNRMPATSSAPATATGGLTAGGPRPASGPPPAVRLRDIKDDDDLADLLAATIAAEVPASKEQARLIVVADEVAHDPAVRRLITRAATAEEELNAVLAEIQRRAAAGADLTGQGAGWLTKARDRLSEGLGRALDLPTYSMSIVLAEARKPLNDLVSVFLGDVFVYLRRRGTGGAPGDIPKRVLDKLRHAQANKQARGGEPLVVLSHSMGGQLVYDAVTHFLPGTPDLAGLRIDFWCATASQVGFFEEAKLLMDSKDDYRTGKPVPFPTAHLGVWWNIWDHNDIISFTARDIIAGVDDQPFDSGMSLLTAHGGYLQRPSFFRRFAEKLEEAKTKGWRTP